MRLGIIATSRDSRAHLLGFSRAARARGHEVSVFLTDSAVALCRDAEVAGLAEEGALSITYCTHSARRMGIEASEIPEGPVGGSQYAHALIHRTADRVISL